MRVYRYQRKLGDNAMKNSIKTIMVMLLVGTVLLTSCADKKETKRRKHKKRETKIESLYSADIIEDEVNANEIVTSYYYDYDCYRVNSSNKYNNARFLIFDTEKEAQEFYDYAIENYLTSCDYSDEKYSIGWEFGVCDASIKDMILIDKNMVMVAEVSIYGEWVGPDEDTPSGTVYLSDRDIESIVEQWS